MMQGPHERLAIGTFRVPVARTVRRNLALDSIAKQPQA